VQHVSTSGRIWALDTIKPAFLNAISCQFGGGVGQTKGKGKKKRKGNQGKVREKGGEYSTIGKKKKEKERKAREEAAAAPETEESRKNHPLSLLLPPPPPSLRIKRANQEQSSTPLSTPPETS